jgi:hypothetical protein
MTSMPPELRTFCEEMRQDMGEVKTALIGNKYQSGLIERVDAVETTVKAHDKKFIVWSAILSAAGAALVFLKDLLHRPS